MFCPICGSDIFCELEGRPDAGDTIYWNISYQVCKECCNTFEVRYDIVDNEFAGMTNITGDVDFLEQHVWRK